MHAVNIGIRSHYHLIISEGVQTLLDIQCSLQEVELLILIDHLLGKSEGVQGFSTQREHCLCIHITALGDTSAC